MPSYLHELILLLFRNRFESAADLLRELDVEPPEHDEINADAADLNDVQPAEYRADLVLFLLRQTRKVLGIVVEVQLSCDEDKPYTWPAYIANLRARHRCPVCLLVITVEEAVARWASRVIDLGPGSQCKPWVVGPSNTPVVTELGEAQQRVELAVLSAIEHGQSKDTHLAARTVAAAIVASAAIDAERSKLYLDLILISLVSNSHEVIEATMNSLGFEYQSDFARKYVAQGRLEIVLKQLASRFGPLTEAVHARVSGADSTLIGTIADRMLTAQTLEEVLGSLP